jgi:hypothetical protein
MTATPLRERAGHYPNRISEPHRIIALAFIAIVALIIVSFAVHFLFSPWLLVAVAIVAWIRFRPRRSQR